MASLTLRHFICLLGASARGGLLATGFESNERLQHELTMPLHACHAILYPHLRAVRLQRIVRCCTLVVVTVRCVLCSHVALLYPNKSINPCLQDS